MSRSSLSTLLEVPLYSYGRLVLLYKNTVSIRSSIIFCQVSPAFTLMYGATALLCLLLKMDLLTNIPGKQSAPEARTHNISTVDDNSSQHTEAHGIAEARTVNPDSTAAALTAAEEILDAKQQVQYENVPGVEEQSTGVEEQSTAAALTATEDIAKQQVRYENLQLKAAVKEGRQHTSDEPRDAGAVSHISPDSQHHPLKQELQQPPAQAPPDDMAQLPQSQDTPHNHKVPVNPPQEESGQQNYPIVAGSTVSQRQPAATDTLIIDPPPEMSYNLGVGSLIKIPTVGGIFKYGTIKWTGHLQPHMQGVVAGIEMVIKVLVLAMHLNLFLMFNSAVSAMVKYGL